MKNQAANPKKNPILEKGMQQLRIGVAYYPEHWGRHRMPTDAQLMRDAGIQIVRLAEFAWSRMEPSEGVFDFSWLDEAIEIFGKVGIRVVLGTPTAAPPAWLHQKYDIYPRDEWRRPLGFGTRLQRCLNHPMMRKHSRIITEAMARHFGNNPHVEAWQTDNELTMNYCYCDHCAVAFREWLKNKYRTLEVLNEAWGTIFWSQEYTDWEQIPLPWIARCGLAHNPSLLLDFRRFQSDSTVSFQKEQVDILRQYCPNHLITHNLMGLNDSMDYFALAQDWDFAAWDNYPITPWGNNGMKVPLGHDYARGMKNAPFWVMEEQVGIGGWDVMGPQTQPGQMRAWAWQAISHGAKAVFFFRWRSCIYGTEQFWHGILNHDGIPRRHYKELQQLTHECSQLEPILGNTSVHSDVAILHAADEHYAYHIQPQLRGWNFWEQMLRFYRPLWHMGVNIDVVSPSINLEQYKLVIMPGWLVLDDITAEKIRQYVTHGGTVILSSRTGVKNANNVCVTLPLPGLLRDVAGITIVEYNPLGDKSESVRFADGTEANISCWADMIELDTAEPFAWYKNSLYSGTPAITYNQFGSGKAWYCGTFGDETFYNTFLKKILSELQIIYFSDIPKEVSIRTLNTDTRRFLVLINLSAENQTFTLPGKYQAIFGDSQYTPVTLTPFEVRILEDLDYFVSQK